MTQNLEIFKSVPYFVLINTRCVKIQGIVYYCIFWENVGFLSKICKKRVKTTPNFKVAELYFYKGEPKLRCDGHRFSPFLVKLSENIPKARISIIFFNQVVLCNRSWKLFSTAEHFFNCMAKQNSNTS